RPAILHKSEYMPGAAMKRLIVNFAIPADHTTLSALMRRALSVFDASPPIFRFAEEVRARVFAPINEIFKLGKKTGELYHLQLHAKFIEFLCALAEQAGDNQYRPEVQADSISAKIYSIAGYIHANYAKELSLEEIARQFYISPYYLSHQFKKVTSFTLVHYIQMTRVRNAQQLLLYTDMKITDITDACGFTSFSQFNRVFNKFCQTSPTNFRTAGRQKSAMVSDILLPPMENAKFIFR
ncbi:MAG: helix-turn-helix transcriptional regulator, partial [Oscillospiraceae bacterium]